METPPSLLIRHLISLQLFLGLHRSIQGQDTKSISAISSSWILLVDNDD
jgi:hypothetical protein